jgi:RimJ/RimL family protein N-acetyltransferase
VREHRATPRRLVLRADATAAQGAGHVMRCLTLGEAWIDAGFGDAVLMGAVEVEFAAQRLTRSRVGRADANLPLDPSDIVVVDAYDDATRARHLSDGVALRVLVDDLDDTMEYAYDALWNPNAYGPSLTYPRFGGTKLLGEPFVPVRADLPRWAGPTGDGTFVVFGGGAIDESLAGAMRLLAPMLPAERFSGVGAWVPEEWTTVAGSDLWPAAATSTRVITAAGSTTWELSHVGAPAVVVVLADNQEYVGRWAASAGVPVVDVRGMSARQIADALVDALHHARALPRVRSDMRELAYELARLADARAINDGICLRAATMDDARALLDWANDPATRAASYGRAPIAWESHVTWLERALHDAATLVLIAESQEGERVGSVRFDTRDDWRTARLSYVVAPNRRGRGLSRAMVAVALRRLREAHPRVEPHATVMISNPASLRVFRDLGWRESAASESERAFTLPALTEALA